MLHISDVVGWYKGWKNITRKIADLICIVFTKYISLLLMQTQTQFGCTTLHKQI